MTREEKAVLRAIEKGAAAVEKASTKAEAEIEKARKAVKVCTHPAEAHVPFHWEHDDGYGRQSDHTGAECQICEARNYWPQHSKNWATREDLR